MWNVAASGGVIAKLKGHSGGLHNAPFSNDGKRVITASYDGTGLWDAATGAVSAKLEGHSEGINSAAFSSDRDRW